MTNYFFLCLSFLLALIFSNRMKRRRAVPFPLPPGPKPWPLVGCLFQMVRNRPSFRWIHKIMHDMNTEIACIRLANIHVIPVSSPDLSCEFLKQQDSNFSGRPVCFSGELVSFGYLATAVTPDPTSDHYKKMKRILVTEVLCNARHKWLHDKRNQEADHLVRYIYNQCKDSGGSGLVNLRTATRHYCGNLMRKLVFNKRFFGDGKEDGGPGVEEEEHVDAIFTSLAYLYAFDVSDYIPWLKTFDLGGHDRIIREALRSVKKYQDREIEQRIQIWRNGFKVEPEDLLDVLITLKDENGEALLTIEEIKAQVTE